MLWCLHYSCYALFQEYAINGEQLLLEALVEMGYEDSEEKVTRWVTSYKKGGGGRELVAMVVAGYTFLLVPFPLLPFFVALIIKSLYHYLFLVL
jgi:hypothetical protein